MAAGEGQIKVLQEQVAAQAQGGEALDQQLAKVAAELLEANKGREAGLDFVCIATRALACMIASHCSHVILD